VSSPTITPPPSRDDGNKLLATRRGSLTVALIAAVLAAAVLVIFLNNYRDSVGGSNKTETVLVARSLLPKGSTGDAIASNGLFQAVDIKHSQVKDGAITDPAALRHKVLTREVFSGEQLTTHDLAFTSDRVVNKLSGNQRAVEIPVDSAHGMLGQVQAGDHVDVYGAYNVQNTGGPEQKVLKEIMQNVEVLKISGTGGGAGGGGAVILRAPETVAAQMAFTAENGKIWISARPQAGAKQSPPSITTIDTILFGIKPISAQKLLRSSK
jgi:Flp pilus assembly protein CpaB